MVNNKSLNLISRDEDEIRIAIVGLGKMGNFHLRSLRQLAAGEYEDYYKGAVSQQLKKIRVCGLCDVKQARLAEHSEIPGFRSFQKLIDETDPHMAIIATPTETHFGFAQTALKNGLHALVEKPLVTSSSQVAELADTAGKNGLGLISGHVERYNPVSIKIVSLLESDFGGRADYSFVRTQRHDERIPDDIIVDKVVHDIDLAMYFFGPIRDVKVSEVERVGGKVCLARIETVHNDDRKGSIFVSWKVDDDEKKRQVEISCGSHKLLGDFAEKKLIVDGRQVQCDVPGMIRPENNQIKDELVDFILYCSEPTASGRAVEPLLNLDEIVRSVKLIDRIKAMTAE